jgi:hypothetical protein
MVSGSLTRFDSFAFGGSARAQGTAKGKVKQPTVNPQGTVNQTRIESGGATGASTFTQMCAEGNDLFRHRVYFDGGCRKIDFFKRFLSRGAELVGVAGPRTAGSDTGVIVIESGDDQEVSEVFVIPEKRKAGFSVNKGYQYRAEFAVVAIRTYRTWRDPQGFVNQVAELKGPTTVYRNTGPSTPPSPVTAFSTISWVHRVQTTSGWKQTSSDGMQAQAIASSGGSGGTYCDTAAAGVDLAATGLCAGTAAGLSIGSAVVAGVATGVGIYVFVPGTKTADSIAAGIGGGIAMGAGVATVGITAGALICSGIGDFLGAAVGDYCNAPPTAPSPVAISFTPLMAPGTEQGAGSCPAGYVRYTGKVTYCTSQNGTTEVNGEEIEEVRVVCYVKYVSNACVHSSSM